LPSNLPPATTDDSQPPATDSPTSAPPPIDIALRRAVFPFVVFGTYFAKFPNGVFLQLAFGGLAVLASLALVHVVFRGVWSAFGGTFDPLAAPPGPAGLVAAGLILVVGIPVVLAVIRGALIGVRHADIPSVREIRQAHMVQPLHLPELLIAGLVLVLIALGLHWFIATTMSSR